ncbi:MAG: RagB/SusD family nutrient uptake outer membrane protein [Bacteroidaceae bacterium]|nr:RagB/SusD family nutrient uptake outer membrane protein [Bacteroidaceae bacterium]
MKRLLYILFASSLMLTTACESKLDIDEHGVLPTDKFYSNDAEIESANLSLYYQLRSMEYTFMIEQQLLSDNFWAGGGVRGDNPILEKTNEFTFDGENDYINSIFSNLYRLNFYANTILEKVSEENASAVARRARAEAKAFIGYAYFYLTAYWGTPPLIDHCLSADEYWQPNCDQATLWAYCEKNLTEAINSGDLVEKTDLHDNETWRITKQTAQAILGKVYMWQGRYSEAAAQFEAVRKSNKYALFTEDDYGNMNMMAHKHNVESMLEVNRSYDTANPGYSFTLTFCTTNWRVDKMNGHLAWGINYLGWGFMGPQKGLYDAFVARDGDNDYRRKQTLKSFDELAEMGIHINDGEDIPSDGVFMWKTRSLSESLINSPFADARNIRYMRYTEVLFCDAECLLQSGDKATALSIVNEIRARSFLPALTDLTMDDIKIEKRLECVDDWTRFMDLVRWGDAYEVLKDQGAYMPFCNYKGVVTHRTFNNDPSQFGFKKGKHELLPFPSSEIRTNPNIKQNPGY